MKARSIGAENDFGTPVDMAIGEKTAGTELCIQAHAVTGTMTPECCTHWDWGCVVSLTGGNGENILTSLDAGGAARVQPEMRVQEEKALALEDQ